MGSNLININSCYKGWIYVKSSNGGVEKTYGDIFAQSNVMAVTPGDVIDIYGATPNVDFFFVTNHSANDINKTVSSFMVTPIRGINGLSSSRYTVPSNIRFISVAFIQSLAGKLDVHVDPVKGQGTVCFLGDSITQGHIAPNVWANPNYPEIVGDKLKCNSVNYGVAGTSICEGSAESFVARLGRMTESWVDCLVILGGTNDYGAMFASKLGNIKDPPGPGKNFYAAYKHLLQTAMNKFPMAQILVVTPTRRCDTAPNGVGISMEDIVRAEKEVAQYYGVRCFDYFHDGGFNPSINARFRYTSDGLHPNQEGINLFIGPTIAEQVEPLIRYRRIL